MAETSQEIVLDINRLRKERNHVDLPTLLRPLTQLTLYPGQTRIDYGSALTFAEFRDEDDKLILKLTNKTNIQINEFGGIGIDKVSGFHKSQFMAVSAGGNDGRTIDFRILAFTDINDNELFTAFSRGEMTTINSGPKVLGRIDATALDLLSRPNVIITDKEGTTLLEIEINDRNVLKAPKLMNQLPIFSTGDKEIGKLGRGTTLKGSYFGVTFSGGLEPETKALLISSSFIVYSSLFAGKHLGGFNDDGGRNCCRVYWKPLLVVVVVICIILAAIIVIRM